MMTIIGAIIYFIIGGIVAGIITMINDDTDDKDDIGLGLIVILWPITIPLLIGITIIAALINIIARLFIKNKKH